MAKVRGDDAEREALLMSLQDLQTVENELSHRLLYGNPVFYGLPDLLFPRGFKQGVPARKKEELFALKLQIDEIEKGDWIVREPLGYEETVEQYQARQNEVIRNFVERQLWVARDGRKQVIRMIPALVDFISDMFYMRERKAIVWKPRGGGGSLAGGIIIWLYLVYKQLSVINLAGSQEQARVVYKYVEAFWECFPDLKQFLLEKPPTMTETKLVTGVVLRCVPATEKQTRGKHFPVLVVDEGCQGDATADRSMRAAMSGVASEENNVVIVLSTFHVPTGLYQEIWDQAEAKGFKRYSWNVFDTMTPCQLGMEEATPEDPQAKAFCARCFLTWYEDIKDEYGKVVARKMVGCAGRARTSKGWSTFDQTCEAKRVHLGTNTFPVEFECRRPSWQSSVYDAEAVDASLIEETELPELSEADEMAVGIDWGIETAQSLAICPVIKGRSHAYVLPTKLTDNQLVSFVVEYLNELKATWGPFVVFADGSHQFNNRELMAQGFDVTRVDFGTWKKFGIGNVAKYFLFKRIKVVKQGNTALVEQLKNYRRSQSSGQVLKKADHGPDALLCAMLKWRFEEHFGPDMDKAGKRFESDQMLAAEARSRRKVQESSDGAVVLI